MPEPRRCHTSPLAPVACQGYFVAHYELAIPDARKHFGWAMIVVAAFVEGRHRWRLHTIVLEAVQLCFPPPEANWPIYSPQGDELYRLDLAWPLARIALEYDGYAVHHGREEQDARRIADLERRGWIVIVVTAEDLRDSARFVKLLREAFERRGVDRQTHSRHPSFMLSIPTSRS